MIFDSEERRIIEDVRDRKSLESSIYSAMDDLPIALRSCFTSMLESDISRCDIMLSIADNDFTDIQQRLSDMTANTVCIPIEVHEHYLSSLTSSDMTDESAFAFYNNLLIEFDIELINSSKCIDDIRNGKDIISYSDFIFLQKIDGMFREASERYEILREETDLPYEDAKHYIDCMRDECSLLMRIHLSKQIAVYDLCYHLDYRQRVSPENFNKLFLPEIAVEDRVHMLRFQSDFEKNTFVLISRMIVNFEMGL